MVLDGDKHEVTSVAKGQQGNLLAAGLVVLHVLILVSFYPLVIYSSKLHTVLVTY